MKNYNCVSCKAPMEDGGYIIEDNIGYPSIHDGTEITFHLCDDCITGIMEEKAKQLEEFINEAKNESFLNLSDYFASQIYVKINKLSGTLYDNWLEMPVLSQTEYLKLAKSVEDKFLKSTNKVLKWRTMGDYARWKHNEIMQVRIRKEHKEQVIGDDGKLLSSSEIYQKSVKDEK